MGEGGRGERMIYQNCYRLMPSFMNIKGLHSTVQKLGLMQLIFSLALAFKSILKKRKREKDTWTTILISKEHKELQYIQQIY